MAIIVGNSSNKVGENLGFPEILKRLSTTLDLSMVKDSPTVSRYAVSSVDGGNQPNGTGGGGGGGGGGGSGTVTSVSVTDGVGISASVANPSTTPDITIALADTAVTPGTYGDGTDACVITVDAQGRITDLSTDPISGGGFTNPMTTEGDIIYEDASQHANRLPIGTAGQVLTVASGLPVWGDINGTKVHSRDINRLSAT